MPIPGCLGLRDVVAGFYEGGQGQHKILPLFLPLLESRGDPLVIPPISRRSGLFFAGDTKPTAEDRGVKDEDPLFHWR